MQNARMLGNYVEYLAEQKGLSVSDLSKALGCDQTKVTSFLKGRSYASFSQISSLARCLEHRYRNCWREICSIMIKQLLTV